jgi:hypothetical protein
MPVSDSRSQLQCAKPRKRRRLRNTVLEMAFTLLPTRGIGSGKA